MKLNPDPTLHKPVPFGTNVVLPEYFSTSGERLTGVVAGIAFLHVLATYIIILDHPIQTEYGETKAVVVNGPELESPDGTNWRLL